MRNCLGRRVSELTSSRAEETTMHSVVFPITGRRSSRIRRGHHPARFAAQLRQHLERSGVHRGHDCRLGWACQRLGHEQVHPYTGYRAYHGGGYDLRIYLGATRWRPIQADCLRARSRLPEGRTRPILEDSNWSPRRCADCCLSVGGGAEPLHTSQVEHTASGTMA